MKITVCSSAQIFEKLWRIQKDLEERGYEVLLPSMIDFHHIAEDALAKIQGDLIKEHFRKIERSDAILVVNYEKKGIKGYIGGNTFLEMGLAAYREIPIFLVNSIPEHVSYREELLALKPIVIGKNWDMLATVLKERSHHHRKLY